MNTKKRRNLIMSIIEDLKNTSYETIFDLDQMIIKPYSKAIEQLLLFIKETNDVIRNGVNKWADPDKEWFEYAYEGIGDLIEIISLNLRVLYLIDETACEEYVKKMSIIMRVINDQKQLLYKVKDIDV